MARAPPSALAPSPLSISPPRNHGRPHGPPAPVLYRSASPPPPRPRGAASSVGALLAPASFFRCSHSTLADVAATSRLGRRGIIDGGSRKRSFMFQGVRIPKASSSGISPSDGSDGIISDVFEDWEVKTGGRETSFLAKLAIALGIAATITVISISFKQPSPGSSFRFPFSFAGSSPSVSSASPVGFTLSIFGYKVILPEYTPGWVYFWLLMAAGCGLFISEEVLNVWVGISLARTLSLDGTWKSFVQSFSNNAPYVVSTVLWVYWGVCISDMIPFYLGKLFRKTKASADICTKLGIGKDKVVSITRAVQKYGNMIGFVERFSVGVRNPTSFLAGAWGIPSDCFFAGVCCGGLLTLPIQLGIGFLLRERPMMALAGVATAVGIWTVFPYILAACAALFIYLRQHLSNQ